VFGPRRGARGSSHARPKARDLVDVCPWTPALVCSTI